MKGEKKFENEKLFLQKVLQNSENGEQILSIEVSAVCNVGDNYMSQVYRFDISLVDGNNNIEEKHLLMKKLPSNAAWKEAFGCELAFINEATSYNVIIPTMNKFRGEDKLAIPACFHASSEYTILEDLKPQGFKTVDRRLGLDLIHAKLALKELGRFHGTSLAMKHSQPEAFLNLTSKLQEICFFSEKEDALEAGILNSVRIATVGLKIFEATGNESFEAALNKIQNLKQSPYLRLVNSVQQKGPLSVICHGDFYLNNIMFKYSDADEVSQVMLIDLQTFRYASLSLDLLYFFTSSLRPGVMSSHFEELMETYRGSLNDELKKLAPKAPQVSLNEIYDELQSHSAYGLLMGFLVLPAVTALPGSAMDIEKEKGFSAYDCFQRGLDLVTPEYFRRIKQVVKDFEALGYL